MPRVAFDPSLLDADEVSSLLVVAMVDRRCIDIVVVAVAIGADADADADTDAVVVGFTVLVIN